MTALRMCCQLLALALLCGCAGSGGGSLFSQPDPDKRYFALQAERPMMACTTGENSALKVRRTRVAPTYSSRELIYRTGEDAYISDYYNLFLVSPQDMLTEAVLEWFSGSGLFSQVLPATSALRPDYVLESSATRLYGDFSQAGKPKTVLEIQFFLLQDDDAQLKVIFCKDYVEETPLADRSPAGLVAGYQKALHAILGRLEADMAQTLGRQAPQPEG